MPPARHVSRAALSLAFGALGSFVIACEALFPLDNLGPATADGGTDASCDAGFCACRTPAPKFCDDFERADPQGAWTSVIAQNAGTVEIVPAAEHGRALRTSAQNASGPVAVLSKQLTGDVTEVHYAFDMQIVASTPSSVCTIAVEQPGSPSRRAEADLELKSQGQALAYQIFIDGTGTTDFGEKVLAQPFPLRTWVRVQIDVTLSNSPRVSMSVDGAQVASADAPSGFAPGPLRLEVGARTGNTGASFDLLFDNVTVY